MIESDRIRAIACAVAARAEKFPSTLPLPKPIQFCFPRRQSAFADGLPDSRVTLERLSMAMEHLERAATTIGSIDGRANWCMAILMYESAVECLTAPGTLTHWRAVRNSIAHCLDVSVLPDSGFAEVAAGAASAFGSSWSRDAAGNFIVPKTLAKAIPILDFRQTPTGFALAELGNDIRGARCFVAMADVRKSRATYVEWESLMAEITARIWCDWHPEESIAWVNLPRTKRILGQHEGIDATVPDGLQLACRAFVDLIDATDGLMREWLLDECASWLGAQDQFLQLRMRRRVRQWSQSCDAHHKSAQWRRHTPMCEALNLDGNLCSEIAASPDRVPQTVKNFVNPFLDKNSQLD